jgi:putative glutamine amidotransferase
MKYLRSVLLLILLSCISMASRGQDTLLLFNPHAYNLALFQQLADDGLFSPGDYHLLGVYHAGQANDFSGAKAWLETHPESSMSLLEIQAELKPENIFDENPASKVFRELFKGSRGALFMGGPDIPPGLYGEEVNLLTSVTDPHRHYLELSFLFHLLGGSQDPEWTPWMEENTSYLINGICLGMQTMNVATGGSMVQDIPTEIYGLESAEKILALPPDQMHRNYMDMLNTGCEGPTSYHFHQIILKKRMALTRSIRYKSDTPPLVLSSHHQAIDVLGEGWNVAATSMDGKIVEAIQHARYHHVIGVQFHPEKPGLFDPSIRHQQSCDSTINFQEAIKNSDSYTFHTLYWEYLEKVLK